VTHEQIAWQEDLVEIFGDAYDPTFVPVWHASWSDHEECGWIYLLEKDGQHYLQQGGYSVMAEDNTPFWNPWRVSEAEALDEMISRESQG